MKLILIICLWIALTIGAIVCKLELWKALMPTIILSAALVFIYAYTRFENNHRKKKPRHTKDELKYFRGIEKENDFYTNDFFKNIS